MNRVLVDSEDNIIFEGPEAKEVLRILNADIYSVSEEDEVKYEHLFRPLIGKENLRFEIHFDIKFKGIDDWNRPVFKDVDSNLYFGDVNKLFDWSTPKEEVIKWYKEDNGGLEYFGQSFDCEPYGGRSEDWKFNIIE